MNTNERVLPRREPKQRRSRQTVQAVLEAVQRVLKRHGAEAITTNRIAKAAGVSIGSLYQYFPDKQAISAAVSRIRRCSLNIACVRRTIVIDGRNTR